MIIIENNAGTLNEIIFENRNKSYGAYVMRREYDNTILKSLGVTVLFFATISLLAVWLNNTVEAEKKLDTGGNIIKCYDYKVEVDVTPIKKAATAPIVPPVASNPNTAAVSTVINDHAIEQITDPIQSTEGDNNANNHPAGTGDIPNNGAIPTSGTGTGPEIAPTNEPVEASDLDVLPSLDNMGAFLQKNLKYPEIAIEEHASGKVMVNFIIDEEGKIVSATLLNHVGYGCDEEALRVVKLMPKWKPGMVKGKPVKVRFSLPIVFRLQ